MNSVRSLHFCFESVSHPGKGCSDAVDVEPPGADNRIAHDYEGEVMPSDQRIEGDGASGFIELVQIGLFDPDRVSESFVKHCLQNLETPLQRQFSNSAWIKSADGIVATIVITASTTRRLG